MHRITGGRVSKSALGSSNDFPIFFLHRAHRPPPPPPPPPLRHSPTGGSHGCAVIPDDPESSGAKGGIHHQGNRLRRPKLHPPQERMCTCPIAI